MAIQRISLAERFWSKVQKTETCWLWTRQLNTKGYGCFVYYSKTLRRKSRNMYAHRVAWTLTHGPIPDSLNVLHKCDTPACVNPDHLFLGTQGDNMRDCSRKGRSHKGGDRSHLSPDDVRAIRLDTRKHHIIAADYGMKRLAIWKIKHRLTFQHIE